MLKALEYIDEGIAPEGFKWALWLQREAEAGMTNAAGAPLRWCPSFLLNCLF